MTQIRTRRSLLVAAMMATLAACGGGEAPEGEAHDAPVQSSSAGLPAGRIEAGGELANAKGAATGQSCIDCHGAEGNAPIDDTYPKLGGQYADYIAHALQAYRAGHRENALMASQAKGLDDQQIADLAAWFASRPSQLATLEGVHED
ncbi:cytochrome c [Luteimonas pelagia]